MCNPIPFMIAATALSAYSQVQQGKAAQAQAGAQAQQAVNQAAYQADAAEAQAENIRKAGRAEVGASTAALAASGVKLGEGTALEIRKGIMQDNEQDALSAILGGKRAVAAGDEQASLLKTAGANARSNANLGAAATVLGGASRVAGAWK